MAVETEDSLRFEFGRDKAGRCGRMQRPHNIEDYEKLAPPQRALGSFGRRGPEADEDRNAVIGSDEEKPTTGRARVLQRRGRARVRELVKMADSMPAEARRLSSLEAKSVTRETLAVCATSVRESCDWGGLSAGSNVGALEVDRLLKEFMNLQVFRGPPWKGEKLLASVLVFCPTFSKLDGNRLARSFQALQGLQ